MKVVRAVIFDLYGVLGLNGWQDFKHRHFDGRWDAWEPLRVLGQRADAGEVSDDMFVQAIADATGESIATVRYQFNHTQPNHRLLAFIKSELYGHYKLGLLSNTSHDVLGSILSLEEQKLFDANVMSVFEGLAKPDPAMFILMCERLGVRPEECVMVDDQPRHLDTATTLGMQTVLYQKTEQAIKDIREALQS